MRYSTENSDKKVDEVNKTLVNTCYAWPIGDDRGASPSRGDIYGPKPRMIAQENIAQGCERGIYLELSKIDEHASEMQAFAVEPFPWNSTMDCAWRRPGRTKKAIDKWSNRGSKSNHIENWTKIAKMLGKSSAGISSHLAVWLLSKVNVTQVRSP
jgi:hypothetical protein